jgi:hypothetical protein
MQIKPKTKLPGTLARHTIDAPPQRVDAITSPPLPRGKTPAKTHNFEIRQIPIDQIKIEENSRPLNREKVDGLAGSIAEIGLKTPLTVREVNGEFLLGRGHIGLRPPRSSGGRKFLASSSTATKPIFDCGRSRKTCSERI